MPPQAWAQGDRKSRRYEAMAVRSVTTSEHQSAESMARSIRQTVLDQSFRANVGHIGSALSIADLLAAVVATFPTVGSDADDRDIFVLSKGHAALAWYAVLALRGRISADELDTFCDDGSALGVHPEPHTPGVDFASGSLGMGISYAVGSALAQRLRRTGRSTVAVMSDAECNEGITWEAVAFAGHHRLANLVALVDDNGQQALGSTRAILDQSNLAQRWEAFGWNVVVVDGHDVGALMANLEDRSTQKPTVVIAKTVFGSGVPFMEKQLKWHYLPMTANEYDIATQAVAGREAKSS